MRLAWIAVTALAGACITAPGGRCPGQDPATDELKKALGDQVEGAWVYDDIQAGFAEAKKTGKPMLVVFR